MERPPAWRHISRPLGKPMSRTSSRTSSRKVAKKPMISMRGAADRAVLNTAYSGKTIHSLGWPRWYARSGGVPLHVRTCLERRHPYLARPLSSRQFLPSQVCRPLASLNQLPDGRSVRWLEFRPRSDSWRPVSFANSSHLRAKLRYRWRTFSLYTRGLSPTVFGIR